MIQGDAPASVSGFMLDQEGNPVFVNYAFATPALSGNTQMVAAQAAGVRIRVLAVYVHATLAVSVKFQSATTDITATFPVGANGGFVLPLNIQGWFQTNAAEALNINLGLGTSTGCLVVWIPVP